MRITRPLAGLLSAALVGLVPLAAASPAAAAEATTATLEFYDTKVTYGDDLIISGWVTPAGGSGYPDGVAYLQVQPKGSSSWRTVASDDFPGVLYFSGVRATGNASYRVHYTGSASYAPTVSPSYAVKVERRLSIKNPRGTLIKGRVSPSYKRGKVVIHRKDGRKWRKYKVLRANRKGRFQTTHRVFGSRTHYRLTLPGNRTFTKSVRKYTAYRH